MEYEWNMHGLLMEYAWNVNGICIEYAYARHMHAICMEFAWNMYGICMENAWHMHGICMEYVRDMHGLCTESEGDSSRQTVKKSSAPDRSTEWQGGACHTLMGTAVEEKGDSRASSIPPLVFFWWTIITNTCLPAQARWGCHLLLRQL